MSVRLKIILIIILTIALFGATIYYVGSKLLIKNYLDIENTEATKNLERVNDAIANTSSELNVKLADWARWDDTYEFMQDKNKAYIKANLLDGSIQNLKIQGMFFYDTKGRLFYEKVLENDNIASKSVEMYFSSHRDIISHKTLDSFKAGMISLPEGSLLVASQPILTSDGKGPIRGTLIFVKVFDKHMLDSIKNLTHLSIDAFPYDSSRSDIINAKNHLSLQNKYFINVHSKDAIDGYSFISDLNNNPILIIETESSRTIFNQGQKTTFSFMLIAGVFSSFFGIFMILLLEKLIVLRLKRLGNDAREIGQTNDLSKRINMSGKDEIAKLALSINKMLEELNESQNAEEKANRENEEISKKLKERFEELEKSNKLMVGRELKMVELKKEIDSLKAQLSTKEKKE